MPQTSLSSLRQAGHQSPAWVAWLVVTGAFLLGIASDVMGSVGHMINILAASLLLVMVWNVVVYGLILLKSLSQSRHFKRPKPNAQDAISLARATAVMHAAAAALAVGALLALYWRGLVFDYQAAWQSTFLSTEQAHRWLSFVLAPAVWLSGLFGGSALPDVAGFAQLRYPASMGENAGRWIHWLAITLGWVVVLPRLCLAWWSYRQMKALMQAAAASLAGKHQSAKQSTVAYAAPDTVSNANINTKISTIALSLVSHTNVGKTTLARTLLGRDIGEVRDAEHVTHTAERHVLVQVQQGDTLERLELWDTPGFGDSERLAKRLAQAGNPLGWFMSEVWDRFQNRDFWYSQRAVRHILDASDVVLYLINASESPNDLAYLDAELQVLTLIGKPVVVLLNQVGEPLAPALAQAELQRWKTRIQYAKVNATGADASADATQTRCVKDVLFLDAFTRCWVQEGHLLQAIAPVLPHRRAEFSRLMQAWQQRNCQRWHDAMRILAQGLSRAARDREVIEDAGWSGKFKAAGAALGKAMGLPGGAQSPKELAMSRLAERLDADIRSNMDALIRLHHLDGSAASMVLTRMAEHYAQQAPQSESKAALWGGAVTGALMGLKADILSGGLTLGGGLLAGGVLGALGGAGLARGYNMIKGVDVPTLAWTSEVLDDLTRSALLSYLAVAHFGRGRGEWADTERPAFWSTYIDASMPDISDKLHLIWREIATSNEKHGQVELQSLLIRTTQDIFLRLYPDSNSHDYEIHL